MSQSKSSKPKQQRGLLTLLNRRSSRRGISLLWLILVFPVLLAFLALVVEIGNLWLARLELEQAVESNALAAVKEWADDLGRNGTQQARIIGNEFSSANHVRFQEVNLTSSALNPMFDGDLNFQAGNVNGNDVCSDVTLANFQRSSVMVFGAATIRDSGTPAVSFDAASRPRPFNRGGLLVDVTGSGVIPANSNWGFSFRASPSSFINNNLRIRRIVIDVDPNGTSNAFFRQIGAPGQFAVLSNNFPFTTVSHPNGPSAQLDNQGWNSLVPNSQVSFQRVTPSRLRIDFSADGSDDGFAPGDRFRFRARVQTGLTALSVLDADDLGAAGAQITVFYSIAGQNLPVPTVAQLQDTSDFTLVDCLQRNPTEVFDELNQRHLVVHPSEHLDLPCPLGVVPSQNEQSYVEILDTTQITQFAVRSQAEVNVPSVIKSLCGVSLGPWQVRAKATAYFDLDDDEPRLIRVDEFLCGP